MSLVVAGIDDGRVTMVADSKVTYAWGGIVEERSRNLYLNALPKIVILRPDLVVGVTGDDPHRVIERIVEIRMRSIEDVLDHLLAEVGGEFVVAATSPARLWKVGDGQVDGPQASGRTWAGDLAAYEVFQTRMGDRGPDALGLSFQMMSSMQFLTSFNVVPSVGGITMRVEETDAGFFFAGDFMRVGPNRMELSSVDVKDDDMRLEISVPEGGDPDGYDFNVIPGTDPTRGAVGLQIPQTGKALVFSHDRPWEPVAMQAQTASELAAIAEESDIHLTVMPSPFDGTA